MKASIICLLSLLSVFLITGCFDHSFMSGQFEADSTESRVIALASQTDLIFENSNGNINITGSDTAKNIYCNITKIVKSKVNEEDAKSHLQSISINTDTSSTGIKIKTDHPKNDDRNYTINFEILMPDNFNYNLTLGNGNIIVNSTTKNLVAATGNGYTNADVILADDCYVSISIGNGTINFKIPGTTNAAVDASVGNGSVSSSGLNFENKYSSIRTLSGTLGSGSGKIDLSVGNGSIVIGRK